MSCSDAVASRYEHPLRNSAVDHAELERSLNSERTRAGVKAAKRRGVKFGREVKLKPAQIEHARKLIDKGETGHYVANLLNVGSSRLCRALNS